MFDSQVVLEKIGMMFLVMVAGWWAARRSYLTPVTSRAISLLVVQVTFPALIFVQMTGTVTLTALKRGWWIPLFALFCIASAAAIGKGMGALLRIEASRKRTFAFLVAMPNWVFLPFPIAEALYGDDGIRFVLLFNFGAQIVLWTLGIRLLQGATQGVAVWRSLLGNAGILATLGGVALALVWPAASKLGHSSGHSVWWLMGNGLASALKMMGDLTIPLSLLAAGAQLGNLPSRGTGPWSPLAGVMAGRLIVAPSVAMLLLKATSVVTGFSFTEAEFITAAIIVSMPVAISCMVFAERFEGDCELSANAIFVSTLISLATAPLMIVASRWLM